MHHRNDNFFSCAVIETDGDKCLGGNDIRVVGQFQGVTFCPECFYVVYPFVFFFCSLYVLLHVKTQLRFVVVWQGVCPQCAGYECVIVAMQQLVVICLCCLQGDVFLSGAVVRA